MDRLAAEQGNWRAALEWSLQREPEWALRLALALGNFWVMSSYFAEGRAAFRRALARGAAAPPELRARALIAAGFVAGAQGDYGTELLLIRESRELWRQIGDRAGLERAHKALAWPSFMHGDYATARRIYEEDLERQHQEGDPARLASAYGNLATVISGQGDHILAARLFEECLRLLRPMSEPPRLATALHNMGENLYRMGDHARARAALLESRAVHPAPYEHRWRPIFQIHLALPTYWIGEHAAARALLWESLRAARQQESLRAIAEGLEAMAEIAAAEEQPERAVQLLAAAQSVRDRIGLHLRYMSDAAHARLLATLRRTLGKSLFSAAWTAGRALSWQQASDYALADADPSGH
jgi:non-specific serine/threonine protein kinase